MKKKTVFIAVGLVCYTVIVCLFVYFIVPKLTAEDYNGFTTSYTPVAVTDEEKAAIYSGIGLDIDKLKAADFSIYREHFLYPTYTLKDLRYIELHFENIYCNVKIYVHKDEVEQEKERQNPTVSTKTLEIVELPFTQRDKTLRYYDDVNGRIYTFDCSVDPYDMLYQEFLRTFFNKEKRYL